MVVKKRLNSCFDLWEIWIEDEKGGQIGEILYAPSETVADLFIQEIEEEIKED